MQPARARDQTDVPALRQLRELTLWVGDGRTLTQTGRIRLADARELVALLGTRDELDPMNGRFRTTSSADLPELTLLVEWAKACGLVRVARGRLLAVKKHAGLLGDPPRLWDRMFDVFGRLGHALCPDGWAESFLRDEFEHTIDGLLLVTYRRGPGFPISEACALAWELATLRYVLDAATELQLTTARAMNDRDVRRALATLEELGAVRLAGDAVALTERGVRGMRRATGDPEPGDAILELKVTLRDVTPAVWRRLLVPAAMRLDRLHDTIQVAMGWTNSHLHAFRADGADYGPPYPDLDYRDERKAKLQGLVAEPRDRLVYNYDFGDDWEHEIVVERVLAAEPGVRYPRCAGGARRCPPEDCGGSPGYARLREILADPAHDEHARMLEWLGLRSASQFDPAAVDVDEVNAALSSPALGRR
jgi:hypothetical protein